MPNLYSQADSNSRKTWFLLIFFLLFIVGLGWGFAYILEDPLFLVVALGLAFFQGIAGLFYSDKIILLMTNAKEIEKNITMSRKLDDWTGVMQDVFIELYRVTKAGGWVAFEVGEIRKGSLKLDEHVIPLGLNAGFDCAGVVVNQQEFTKTSNIWGVNNMDLGTNTNRIVLFKKM